MFERIIPPKTIYGALKNYEKAFLTGYTKILSNAINRPVIFVYPSDIKKAADITNLDCSDYTYIEDGLETNKKLKHLCREIRNNEENAQKCHTCDCEVCMKLGKFFVDNKNKVDVAAWEKIKDINIYKYSCVFGLTEVIAPITVDEKFAGAFITGQYISKDFNKENEDFMKLTKAQQDEVLKDILNEKSTEFKNFIDELKKVQIIINQNYSQIKNEQEMKFNNKISDMAWGKESWYSDNEKKILDELDDEWERITYRLRMARTHLYDALMQMDEDLKVYDEIGLNKFIVFKPRSDFNGDDNIPGKIPSSDLKGSKSKKKTEGDGLFIDREFHNAEITIDAKDMKEKEQKNYKPIGDELVHISLDFEKIKKYLSDTADLNNGDLIVYFLRDFNKEFVGYYFEFTDKAKKYGEPDSNEYRNLLKNIFANTSSIFLAAWNSIYSEYNSYYYTAANKYIDHEMGHVLVAINSANKIYSDAKNKAEFLTFDETVEAFPKLPPKVINYLKYIDKYCEYMADYTARITSITSGGFIGNLKDNLKISRFLPYSQLLDRLIRINQDQAEYNHMQIKKADPNYKDDIILYADKHKLEQAINNLLRNAVKYSHAYTYIEVSAKESDDNGIHGYEFIITNYGTQISEDEENSIFKLGKRGKNSINHTDSEEGIGFGLNIAKNFAEQHKGKLNLIENNKISDYNIPLFDYYSTLEHKEVDKKIQEECKTQLNHLKETKWENGLSIFNNIVSGNIIEEKRGNSFTPLYCMRFIEMPTARIRFRLWIPNNPKGGR